jgi:hypothetical protein
MTLANVLAFLAMLSAAAAPAQAAASARIDAIEARIFNNKTGAMSEDVLAGDGSAFGNAPIGDLKASAALIVVRVHFDGTEAGDKPLKLRLVATESRAMPFAATRTKLAAKRILDSTSIVGSPGIKRDVHVGFWLPDVGCRTVMLKATILGAEVVTSRDEVLPFTCYE